VRPLLHHPPVEAPRSRGNDGHYRVAHDDSWVNRYVPEFEKRWNRFARPANTSWRVHETYINIRGKWIFPCRAVDKYGKTADFLLRPNRRIAVAQSISY